uniref:Uncharacterized protein n=1 Tax=Odontella aurita TaxID=265563 RepID=A0A7S4HK19_9STRA|mmetsp:Transcript_11230/g.33233  ORF Transcript_11230/g.33233 Transcript_11230/m.33233 type:complete len:138 (+) Transcript_11230:181-594(+)
MGFCYSKESSAAYSQVDDRAGGGTGPANPPPDGPPPSRDEAAEPKAKTNTTTKNAAAASPPPKKKKAKEGATRVVDPGDADESSPSVKGEDWMRPLGSVHESQRNAGVLDTRDSEAESVTRTTIQPDGPPTDASSQA